MTAGAAAGTQRLAPQHQGPAQRPRVAPLRAAALAAVLFSSTLSFSNVLQGGWEKPVWGTVLAVLMTAAALRFLRVGPVVALLITITLFALSAGWIIAPGTFVAGAVPSTATISALLAHVHAAHTTIASHVAPITPTVGVLLVICAMVAITTLIADTAVFRTGVPMAALGYAVVIAVPASIIHPEHSVLHAAALVLSIGVFLFSETVLDAAPQSGAPRHARAVGSLPALTAALAGIIALVATPALGLARQGGVTAVPFHGAFQGAFGATGATVHINPVVSLRRDLLASPTVPLFTVTAAHGAYWRLLTLDRFNGTSWSAATGGRRVSLKQAAHLQLAPVVTKRTFVQSVHVLNLGGGLIPSASTAVAVSGMGTATANSATLGISGTRPLTGATYAVRSLVAAPSSARLAAALPANRRRFGPELQLPNVGARVYALAHAITRNQTSAYGRALAIQGYLRDTHRFTYSLAAAPSKGNALDQFLFVTRTGYCQQFAGAMAVLARAVGIPARIAVGFAPGTFTAGHWLVTTADAHSWPELYFPKSGWIRFEPTPGAAGSTSAAGTAAVPKAAALPGTSVTSPTQPPASSRRSEIIGGRSQPSTTSSGALHHHRHVTMPGHNTGTPSLPASLAIGAGVLGGAAMLAGVGRLFLRRRRAQDGSTPRDEVIAAYAALTEWEHAAGLGRRPSETMRAHASRVSLAHPDVAVALSNEVALCEGAVYGAVSLTSRDAQEAWNATQQIQQHIEAQHTWSWRLRVHLRFAARALPRRRTK